MKRQTPNPQISSSFPQTEAVAGHSHVAKWIIGHLLTLLLVVSAPPSTRAACMVAVPAGWSLIANQCVNDNTVATLLPVVPFGTVLLKYDNSLGTFEPLNGFSTAWSYPQQTLAPGEGAWIFNPGAPFVAGLPGVAATPVLPVPFANCSGFFLVSRQTFAVGNYLNIMGAAPAPGATVYKFDSVAQSFRVAIYDPFSLMWEPAELTAGAGEALWISPTGGGPAPTVPSLCQYTKSIPPGWSLFANQCINARTIRSLVPSAPLGTLLLKYDNGAASYEPVNAFSTGWSSPAQILNPGEGAWIFNPAAPFNVFIAGTAGRDRPVAAGGAAFLLVSRRSAGVGNYLNIMGAAPAPGALVYQFDAASQSFVVATYDPIALTWMPAELTAGVGEALWISPTGGGLAPTAPSLCQYTKSILPGWNLFANQCMNSSKVGSLLPSVPFGTLLLKYNNSGAGSYEALNAFSRAWSDPNQMLAPGEGIWIFNAGAPFNVFIAGTAGPDMPVGLGGAGFFLVSREFAGVGNYLNIMGAAPAPGAAVYKFDAASQSFRVAIYDPFSLMWEPAELTAGVGEALWISPTGGGPTPIAPTRCSYTKSLLPGWNAIANQCVNAKTVSSLMPSVPEGSQFLKYNNGSAKWEPRNVFAGGSWRLPSQMLAPGEGAFIRNPTPNAVSILIAGEAGPGGLNAVPSPGCYLVSRKSVGPGDYASIVGAPPEEGTLVFRFNPATQSYAQASYLFGSWDPMELIADVGEPLWITFGSCPTIPCYLDIGASVYCHYVTISWTCPNCQLQQTSVLAKRPADTVWVAVPGTSPVTLPITAGNKFFRVFCP